MKNYQKIERAFINNKRIGLYLHIPFCQGKCRYCDFYSLNYNQELIDDYLISLEREIEYYSLLLNSVNEKMEIETIYFGGGTPGLLAVEEIEKILDLIIKKFSFPYSGEITLEANPSFLTEKKIAGFRELGINRISLGVQSFNDHELKFLGRRHNSREAIEKIKLIKRYFENYSIDLIYALPGQRLNDWEKSLRQAIELSPYHISLYNLQIEGDTPLARALERGEFKEIDDSLDAEMYLLARKFLAESAYQHYEISNFARKGYQAKHNHLYWEFKPYLGLGPAAHSFTGAERFSNYSDLSLYIDRLKAGELAIEDRIELKKEDLMAEMVFMGLRLLEGVSFTDFYRLFHIELRDYYKKAIDKLKSQGLLNVANDKISLTEKGLLLANIVFMEFLP